MRSDQLPFRDDIHALRALAVLSVVLYHFGATGFAGGFTGVDVFFVISGYLMTAIVVGGMEAGQFSLWRFYWSRIRRIVPALAALCAVLLLFGWFYIGPAELMTLAEHVLSTLSFSSNFVYKGEAGYFDAPSQQKWLLHSWALSTEWQFYLLYPLLILAISRYAAGRDSTSALFINRLRWWLVGLALASLLLSVVFSGIKPSFSFFLLPTRIWEMVAGGLVYLSAGTIIPRRFSSLAAWAGLAMIGTSWVLFDSDSIWPGYAALLPVTGAVLFMAATPRHPLVTHPWIQRIGDWSYSIYLWHWPVYVALIYTGAGFAGWQWLGVALSVLLGALSYYLVEQPARRLKPTRQHVMRLVVPLALLVAAWAAIWWGKGFPQRVDAAVQLADNELHNRLPPTLMHCHADMTPSPAPRALCLIAPQAPAEGAAVAAIMWGDSHAGSTVGALQDYLQQPVAYFANQCPVIFDARLKGKTQRTDCRSFHQDVRDYLAAAPAHIPLVIVSRFSAQIHGPNETRTALYGLEYAHINSDEHTLDTTRLYQKRLLETLCTVAKQRPTYVLRPIPELGQDAPRTIVRLLMTGQTPQFTLPRAQYDARHAVINATLEQAREQCGVLLVDTPAAFCPDGGDCIAAHNGRPLYVDDDHLSEYGNRRLIAVFAEAGL